MESERIVDGIWHLRSSTNRAPGAVDWPRVAILHSFYKKDVPSGENATVLRQFEWLGEAGVDVGLISVSTDDLSQVVGYKLRTAWGVALGRGRSPLRALSDFEPDVVHIHNLFPNVSAHWIPTSRFAVAVSLHNYRPLCAAATLSRDGHDCRLCIDSGSIHGLLHRCYRGSLMATAPLTLRGLTGIDERDIFAGADALLAPSETVRRAYASAGVDSVKVLLQPTSDRGALVASNDSTQGRFLFIGRLTPEKGIEELLTAWPAHLPLTIIGQGPLDTVAEDLVRNRQLDVVFLGRVSDETLAEELRSATALVFPSTWREGAPAVYAEALSARLPVVAVRGNAVAEFVEQDETGVVVDELTESSLLRALEELTHSAEALKEVCRTVYLRDYTRDAWVAKLKQIYFDAIASRTSRMAK